MKKVLFLIHDLSVGGAEKVLVNLVNNMDASKFDITVMTLFDVGVNKQFLAPHIHYKSCFKRMIRGNSHLMKLLTPKQLHKWLIKDKYDIEVAYLEGPSARVISGCNDDILRVSWIHCGQFTKERASGAFRNYRESAKCYKRFHKIICVSEAVQKDFCTMYPDILDSLVLYNTNESNKIKEMAQEQAEEFKAEGTEVRLIGVGKVIENKGFDRLARIHKRLLEEGYNVHTYILGVGDRQGAIEKYAAENGLEDSLTFLGYQTNPYKYVAKSDLFVCASYAEGFSTAATEALIVGTPVCTVEVAGMKEMLGENNEYGVIVENDEETLYQGIRRLLSEPSLLEHYRQRAAERGMDFSTEKTVKAVEDMLLNLVKNQ